MEKFILTAVSDRGVQHKENEDSFYAGAVTFNETRTAFALVADGMGSTSKAKEASETIAKAFGSWYENLREDVLYSDIEGFLYDSWMRLVKACNEKINREESPGGTTLVCCLFVNGTYYAINIGDSRMYHLKADELFQITEDHSYLNFAQERGIEIDSSSINKITKFIGCGFDQAVPDFFAGTFRSGECFFLCSDGMRHKVKAEELRTALAKHVSGEADDEKTIGRLMDIAMQRGEKDNLTGITVRVL